MVDLSERVILLFGTVSVYHPVIKVFVGNVIRGEGGWTLWTYVRSHLAHLLLVGVVGECIVLGDSRWLLHVRRCG